jgi:CheY-like chemotaxis protein
MSDDLILLRMLLVAAVPSQRDLWQEAATMASVPIEFAAKSAADSVAALRKGGVDICVFDATLSDGDKAVVTDAARKARPAPLLFVSTARGVLRPDNVDAAFARPANIDDACKLVEICVRARVPTRVLIVDDSRTTRSLVRKILSASRFALDIHEASEGTAAIKQIGNGRYDLVFLDYNMPGLNGFETLAEIKRQAPGVSVVMMTSLFNESVVERAQASGALAFLKKPFYPANIDTVLERHFGLHVPVA